MVAVLYVAQIPAEEIEEWVWRESHFKAARVVNIATAAATSTLTSKHVVLMGMVLVTGGSAGSVLLFNGTAGSGDCVGAMERAANLADTEWFGDSGIDCPSGLSCVVAGTITNASALVRFKP